MGKKTYTTATAVASSKWRDHIDVHPACDAMPALSTVELEKLAKNIATHGLREPISFWIAEDGSRSLLDGRGRLNATGHAGLLGIGEGGDLCIRSAGPPIRWTTIRWRSYDKSDGDPRDIVHSLNIERRHLNTESKRAAVDALLRLDPSRSDRQIAEQTGSSPTFVGKERRKAEKAGGVSTVDTRTDSTGRKQPARKPKSAPKKASKKTTPSPEGPAVPARSNGGDPDASAAERKQWPGADEAFPSVPLGSGIGAVTDGASAAEVIVENTSVAAAAIEKSADSADKNATGAPDASSEAGEPTSVENVAGEPDVLQAEFDHFARCLMRSIANNEPARFAATTISGADRRELSRFLMKIPGSLGGFMPADDSLPEDLRRAAS